MSRLGIVFIAIVLLAATFLAWAWWKFSNPVVTKPPVFFTNEGDKIRFSPDSEFVKGVLSEPAKKAPGGRNVFHAVGQILLLVEPSGALIGSQKTYVHLDQKLSARLGIEKPDAPINTSFGIVEIPKEQADQMRVGSRLLISLYGLRKASAVGRILKIQTAENSRNFSSLLFKIDQGRDWYPGANCEIHFPEISSVPSRIPARSIVHFRKSDHVFIEWEKGLYSPRVVTVLEEDDTAFNVLGVKPGERVVTKGAILLQPFLTIKEREDRGN
ncbi:hypothetical protein LEP1GSC058_3718 [Leptospira fainei serovar Hurstbridge str. BUT 6]|uniref:HlyD family secretion protein n=1 Tax=Leptospira fainei serovar Hurstbridge str. BUT 6 TaxID=1193011 RepID=S3UY48_9LEPT|nr:hypothetical protein [Leptospira fainei]EPG73294.1 hypothetical protein LEP1GSC058_3718 [Leptospira fainei serovar Hurstbridge str. BUT 6]